MSGAATKFKKIKYNILLVPSSIFILILFSLGAPLYKGSILSFLVFGVIATTYGITALAWRPSIFLSTTALFLSLGFFIKFLSLNSFGIDLIEPIGQFDGSATQWDKALSFASAGLLGAFLANFVSQFAPSTRCIALSSSSVPATTQPVLGLLLVALMFAAILIYGINLRWNVLRIGYPSEIDLPFPLYPVLAFIITWGALIGALTLTSWLQDPNKAASPLFFYVSGIIGFMASFTMGSRVQFLLYLFAATLVVVSRDGLKAVFRLQILVALFVCGLLFGLSIAAVSLQRSFDFMPPVSTAPPSEASSADEPMASASEIPIAPHTANIASQSGISMESSPAAPTNTPVKSSPPPSETEVGPTMSLRIQFIVHELKSLLIMRWVGLEGVMTTAGSYETLGMPLFKTALSEDPGMGTSGIYQHMSGDLYANVKGFVFLTLPGPIGIASYTGNLALIATCVFVIMLLGHAIEVYSAKVTRNIGCTTAVGVSLAYLFVQMGFPWTLFIYCVELFLAISFIAVVRLALVKFPPNSEKTLSAQA
ncbi:hypothetical protein [Brucella tritici]|uniref:hypothetical protein n=1 Tax=Brucella tritici TaxID=94626 RepID=UPI0015916701|nr:hypothetical protein [Brucella tritici]